MNDTGFSPAWTSSATDSQLKFNSADVFQDINVTQYASYFLKSTFRSLQIMQSHYDLQAMNVVECDSTIENLLRFAEFESKIFRFEVDVIEDTVLFVCNESFLTELITDLRDYDHTFSETYTTWDSEIRSSCSHQRIIQYKFDELKFLIRTKTDDYVKEADAKVSSIIANSTSQSYLDDALETIVVSSTEIAQDQQLQLKMQDMRVRQNQIFDIKMHASYKSFDMNGILSRLWVNQTFKFLIAYHQFDLFDKSEIKNIRQEVIRWENDNSILLTRFHVLVKCIMNVGRDFDQQQCEVSRNDQESLCVTKQIEEERRVLSTDLLYLLEVSW